MDVDVVSRTYINRCRLRRMDFLNVPAALSYADAIALYAHPCADRAFRDILVPKSLVESGTLRKSHPPAKGSG